MVVGVARLNMHLPEKYTPSRARGGWIKGMIGQIRSRFDVAISEVGLHDLWQSAEIGISSVGNSQPVLNSVMDKIIDFVDGFPLVEIVRVDVEYIHIRE